MRSIPIVLLLSLSAGLAAQPREEAMPMQEWTRQVGAQTRPDKTETFNVTDYGAVADGRTINTLSLIHISEPTRPY